MKILCICPSIHSDKLEHMLDSFLTTRSVHTNIIINHDIGRITDIYNRIFSDNPNYDFYMLLNDDIIFETPLWDIELAKNGKISHGTDCVKGGENGQFLMIDGEIARAVGWLQMPTLNRYCGDVVWRFIGKTLKILNHVPEVQITHKWDESQVDQEIHVEDMAKFAEWLTVSYKDIERVKKCLKSV